MPNSVIVQQQQLAHPASPPPVVESKVDRLFRLAEAEIGKRYAGPVIGEPESYRWGNPGWDCSSFVSGMYRAAFGVQLTAYTDAIYNETQPADAPHRGDIVLYRYADSSQPGVRFPHTGLYVNERTVLDARYGGGSGPSSGVGYHPHLANVLTVLRRPVGFSWDDGAGDSGEPDWRAETRAAAMRHGIDPDIFEAQIQQESGFNPDVIYCRRDSSAGARGIAQIVPVYHPNVDPCDPMAALDYAARLMASHLRTYGNWTLALVAYNGGGGAVAAWNRGQAYAESIGYVRAILG